MKIYLLPLLLLFALSISAQIQKDEEEDGAYWAHFSRSDKLSYVHGFYRGAFAGCTVARTSVEATACEKIFGIEGGIKVGDAVAQLDRFYADYRNTPICIDVALIISQRAARGNAPTEQQMEVGRHKAAGMC